MAKKKKELLLLQPVSHPGDSSVQETLVKGKEEKQAMAFD